MRVMIEFDPMAGTAKVTLPTFAREEAVIQTAITGAAQDAGAYTEIAPGEGPPVEVAVAAPTATQAVVEGAAQDAGAYTEIGPEERPSVVEPQSTTASNATATESTPTPTIIDRF